MKTKEILVNGVYFVMNDGTFVSATSKLMPSKEQIKMIGVAHDGHYFAIPLNWNIYGNKPLVTKSCKYDEKFCKSEAAALCDWDFANATKHLQSIGLSFDLVEGHYLPTLAVLLAMFNQKEAINSAMTVAGVEAIDYGTILWSSSRYVSSYAWLATGYRGFFYSSSMYGSYLAVPVSLWEPIF